MFCLPVCLTVPPFKTVVSFCLSVCGMFLFIINRLCVRVSDILYGMFLFCLCRDILVFCLPVCLTVPPFKTVVSFCLSVCGMFLFIINRLLVFCLPVCLTVPPFKTVVSFCLSVCGMFLFIINRLCVRIYLCSVYRFV